MTQKFEKQITIIVVYAGYYEQNPIPKQQIWVQIILSKII